MSKFYFEMTDTFGGELNYCWLNRYTVTAKSLRGALQKISRHTGYNFRNNGFYYKAKGACIGLYESESLYSEEIIKDFEERSEHL